MKQTFLSLLIFWVPLCLSAHSVDPKLLADFLDNHGGTFRGFMPSQQSPVGWAEIELTVSTDGFLKHEATGLVPVNLSWREFAEAVESMPIATHYFEVNGRPHMEDEMQILFLVDGVAQRLSFFLNPNEVRPDKEAGYLQFLGTHAVLPALVYLPNDENPNLQIPLYSIAQIQKKYFLEHARRLDPSLQNIPSLSQNGQPGPLEDLCADSFAPGA